jgi:hypothetical protein
LPIIAHRNHCSHCIWEAWEALNSVPIGIFKNL